MKLLTPPKALFLLAAPIPVPPSEAFLDAVRDELDEACFYFDLLDDDDKFSSYKLLGWYVCYRDSKPAWNKIRQYGEPPRR